jgi:DnaJ-class molecular chaperone
MTTSTLALDLGFDRPSILGRSGDDDAAPQSAAPHDDRSSHNRLTLDQVITGVWEGLSSHHTVTCPVCSGKMTPRYGSGARPVGGRCKRCATTLG